MEDSLRKNLADIRREIIAKDFSRMNDMQRQAVFSVNGPLLILAGAGSGKTTVLINRIAYMIKYGNAYLSDDFAIEPNEDDLSLLKDVLKGEEVKNRARANSLLSLDPVDPWSIMAITFTNKAADELKSRLEKMLGSENSGVTAATFHSVCVRILRRFAGRIGYTSHFTIYDTDDSRRLMKECQKSLGIDDKILSHKTILSHISRAKDSLIDADEFTRQAGEDFRLKKIAQAYSLYEKRIKQADAMDFDDIICNTVYLLRDDRDALDFCQRRYRYIMVDEYQDTNHAQYMFVKLLSGRFRNICVVGDDNQSIYRFRGATIENILSFEKQYPDASVVRLEQNYRSTGNILNAANDVIKNNKNRKEKNLWTDVGDGDPITVFTAADEYGEAKYAAEKILDAVHDGDSFSDCAVLYRMNAQSGSLETVFARSAIPYRVIGGTKFYSRKEVKDILAYLQVISNPSDLLHLRRIINEPKRGIGAATVDKTVEISEGLGIPVMEVILSAWEYEPLARSAAKLSLFGRMMKGLIDKADEMSLGDLVTEVLEKTGYSAYLVSLGEEGEERLENVKELVSSVIRYEQECEEEMPTLAGFLESISLITDIDEYNENNDSVTLMTLHSAKGLEFKNVFIVGMEEGIFPGNQSIFGGEAEIEEERRLAYVGITRAKRHLYLTNAATRMIFGSTMRNRPSRFLLEIPEEYAEQNGVLSSIAPSVSSSFSGNYAGGNNSGYYGGRDTSGGFGRYQAKNGDGNSFVAAGRTSVPIGSSRGAHSRSAGAYSPAAKGASFAFSGIGIGKKTKFRAGDRVSHKTFGIGTVLEVSPVASDSMLTIAFDTVGTKRMMANYARLEPVEQNKG